MRETDQHSLKRIGFAFVIILLFSTTFATAVFLISHTSVTSSRENDIPNSPTPDPDELIIGGAQTTLPETKGVKAPQITTPAPNLKDAEGPSGIFSPSPSPTPLTVKEDTNLTNDPYIEIP